jgi:hypothetical protein
VAGYYCIQDDSDGFCEASWGDILSNDVYILAGIAIVVNLAIASGLIVLIVKYLRAFKKATMQIILISMYAVDCLRKLS